jgi:hypothetical protein
VSKHIARSSLRSRLTGPGSAERVIYTDSRPGGGWPCRQAALVDKGNPI